jgi:outer membrane protein insertion porin family
MMRTLAIILVLVALWLSGCGAQARISGNSAVTRGDLEAAARRPLAAWHEHQRATDLVDASADMRARLDEQGYVSAEVVGTPPPPPPEGDGLPLFTINEGPRAALGEVTFGGDTGLGRTRLRELAALGPWLTSSSISDAPKRIASGLRRAGHLQARVAQAQVRWNDTRTLADVHLVIQAGPRFLLAEEHLDLEGDLTLRSGLAALLDVPGITSHPRLASEAAARLRAHLADRGYRQASVEVEQEIDAARARVSVRLRVRPGVRQTVSAVQVSGGRRTSRSFVDRHLRELQPGQPLSQAKLDQAVSGLTLTGLYRRVQVETIAGEAAPDGSIPTTVELKLKENPSKRVDLSVGYGSYEQLRAGVEYVDDHLFGRGLRFNTGVNGSLKGWGSDIGLLDPYLLGPGRTIGVAFAYSEREEPAFEHEEYSATLTATQKARPRFDPVPYELRATYTFTREEDFAIEAPLPGEEQDGDYTTSAIGFSLRRDAREPKIIDPERGTYAQIGALVSAKPLGAEIEFSEFSASAFGAIDPAPWLVATVHVSGTTREPFEGKSLPIGERLFLGGEDSVRSFTRDDLGPRDVNGDPTGGLTRLYGNIELRWRPFTRHRAFEVATFYDIGMVHPDPWRVGGPPGQAIGAGLRYRTPVGPIRLDYGYNPGDRLGAEDPWALHLAVGFAF